MSRLPLVVWHVTEGRRWVTDLDSGREMSASAVARLAGVSPGTVRRWLTGGLQRRSRTYGQFADFLLRYDAATVRNMEFVERQEAAKREARAARAVLDAKGAEPR